MKTLTKLALVGVALAASAAQADVFLPSTGNGELTLFVKDTVSGAVYARGLGIRMDDVLSASAISGGSFTGPVQSFGYSLPTIGPDANMTSFLAANTGAKVWAIMGGDNQGGIGTGTGNRYVTTTALSAPTPALTNTNLNSVWSQLNSFQTSLNAVLPDSGDNSVYPNGLWDQAAGGPLAADADLWFASSGSASVNNGVSGLGTAGKFFVAATQSTTGVGGAARLYQGVDVRLTANGTLESVGGGPEIPLPPALWLLGSALVGLTGVARRRAAATAVPS